MLIRPSREIGFFVDGAGISSKIRLWRAEHSPRRGGRVGSLRKACCLVETPRRGVSTIAYYYPCSLAKRAGKPTFLRLPPVAGKPHRGTYRALARLRPSTAGLRQDRTLHLENHIQLLRHINVAQPCLAGHGSRVSSSAPITKPQKTRTGCGKLK